MLKWVMPFMYCASAKSPTGFFFINIHVCDNSLIVIINRLVSVKSENSIAAVPLTYKSTPLGHGRGRKTLIQLILDDGV
jgi:hypothetical protein